MSYLINEFYKSVVLKLKAQFPAEEARAMADRLFEKVLLLSPAKRVLSANMLVDEDKIPVIEESVNKLLLNIPLQYVLGKAFFLDMEFIVNPCVLIPRPETEEMVSLILKQYPGRKAAQELNILDIGTGSGCIAIALKRHLPESNVYAIDFSEEALSVAAENARKNNVAVRFIHTDILDPNHWEALSQFGLIVSNPPYVTHEEKKLMESNVLDHEPHSALFVPDEDPLLFYRCIMNFAKARLINGGTIWLEINEAFGQEVLSLFENDIFSARELLKDMFGKNRFVKVIK